MHYKSPLVAETVFDDVTLKWHLWGQSNPLNLLVDATKWACDTSQIERIPYHTWYIAYSSVNATSPHNNTLDKSQEVAISGCPV